MEIKGKDIGILIVVFLLFLVIDYQCPIRFVLGIPCPGCGMTRSLLYLLQGNVDQSVHYHALCIPTILCAGTWFLFRKNYTIKTAIVWVWIALMLVYYAYRLVYLDWSFLV